MGGSFSSLSSSSSPSSSSNIIKVSKTKGTVSSKSLSQNNGIVDQQCYQGEDSSVTFSELMEKTNYKDSMDHCARYEIYINRTGYHWYLLIRLKSSRSPFVTLEITTTNAMQILLACVRTLEDHAGTEYIKFKMTTMKELCDVADDVKKKMGGYSLYSSNFQHFCNNVLKRLNCSTYTPTIGPNTTLPENDLGFDDASNVAQQRQVSSRDKR